MYSDANLHDTQRSIEFPNGLSTYGDLQLFLRHHIIGTDFVAGIAVENIESGVGIAEVGVGQTGRFEISGADFHHVDGDMTSAVAVADSRTADASDALPFRFRTDDQRSADFRTVEGNQDTFAVFAGVFCFVQIIFREILMRVIRAFFYFRNIFDRCEPVEDSVDGIADTRGIRRKFRQRKPHIKAVTAVPAVDVPAFPEKFRRIRRQSGIQIFNAALRKTVFRIKRRGRRNPPAQDTFLPHRRQFPDNRHRVRPFLPV